MRRKLLGERVSLSLFVYIISVRGVCLCECRRSACHTLAEPDFNFRFEGSLRCDAARTQIEFRPSSDCVRTPFALIDTSLESPH